MKLKSKTKILLSIIILSAICNPNWQVSANINSNSFQTAELRDENALNEQLFVSVGLGSAQTVETNLQYGADIHALDGAFQTPLHFVIRRIFEVRFLEGSLDILDTLLEHGADPDFRVDIFPERNLQTPYEYFETHYSNDRNQALVAAVRERLNNHRFGRFVPAPQRVRMLHQI